MRFLRAVAVVLAVLLTLVSCSRDPNVAKKRYLDSGNKYFERGKYKEASIMYRNALQKDMRFGPAHYKLALTFLKLGQLAPAIQSLRRAEELLPVNQPDHWDAVIKLSEIYLAASPGKQYLDEVEDNCKQLLKRDPNSFDGHRLSGDLAYVRATEAAKTAQKTQALELLNQAVAEYRKANAIKPDEVGVTAQLARSLSALGDYPGAEQLYRALITKHKTTDYPYSELYRLLVITGKPGEAEQVLKLGFQNDPKQFGFLTMLAAHYYNQHRQDDMLKVLNEIKSHEKDYAEAYLTVGDFYLRLGESQQAITQYREGMSKDAKQKTVYQKRVIEVLMRQGKREEAAQLNAEILKANPNDNDARGLAATLLLDKGETSRALTELQAVVARTPQNAVAHYNLGRAHEARNEWEQARQELQKAVQLRPDYLLARLALAQLQLRRHEWDGALRTAEQILAIDRGNTNARLLQSAALVGEKRYADARDILQALMKNYPKSPDIIYQIGLVDLADKKFKDAEQNFRRSYDLGAGNGRALLGLVETYLAEDHGDEAIAMLQKELAKNGNRTDYHMALGMAAVRTGRLDLAIEQYQTVLNSLGAGNSAARADLYLRLGETYRLKRDLNSSIAALEQARKVMPDNPAVLSTLALGLDNAGRRSEAQRVYEDAIKADQNNAVALNNLAFLIVDTGGDVERALTLAQRAKQLLPNTPDVSDTLGMIYLRKNLSDNAIDIFRELVNQQPQRATFRYHLAMAFSQKGDKPRARQELQQALKGNPSKEEKEKIQQLINRLT